jgi:hypothetical protein
MQTELPDDQEQRNALNLCRFPYVGIEASEGNLSAISYLQVRRVTHSEVVLFAYGKHRFCLIRIERRFCLNRQS